MARQVGTKSPRACLPPATSGTTTVARVFHRKSGRACIWGACVCYSLTLKFGAGESRRHFFCITGQAAIVVGGTGLRLRRSCCSIVGTPGQAAASASLLMYLGWLLLPGGTCQALRSSMRRRWLRCSTSSCTRLSAQRCRTAALNALWRHRCAA